MHRGLLHVGVPLRLPIGTVASIATSVRLIVLRRNRKEQREGWRKRKRKSKKWGEKSNNNNRTVGRERLDWRIDPPVQDREIPFHFNGIHDRHEELLCPRTLEARSDHRDPVQESLINEIVIGRARVIVIVCSRYTYNATDRNIVDRPR